MFDRYDEAARRALFFSRYAVTQLGGSAIEPVHLVLGVLQASARDMARFTTAGVNALRLRLEGAATGGAKVSTSIEVPFSSAAKMALERAAVEADDLGNHTIRPEHIILGVLAGADGALTRLLTGEGFDADAIRDHLRGAPDDAPTPPNVALATADISREVRPGMVVRQWNGVARPSQADAYVAHLRRETFPALSKLAGFVTASILKRDVEDGVEFQVMTVWHSRAAIEAFAGKDISIAVVPPDARALLKRYDREAVHYEIV